ncbi:hypothetical protein MYX82_11930 [Acidobacteria bacterium AH-259-D05]|nr:hypothetical protein [Acidobacteria bacterium AH-259-D05]
MEGGSLDSGVAALRLCSDVIRWEEREGAIVKQKLPVAPGEKWVGLVLLFSVETTEPLAIFPDGVVQVMRVAATNALLQDFADQGIRFIRRGWRDDSLSG